MKFRISLVLLWLALAASSATAHAVECKTSTIRGTYAFTIQGEILTPGGPLLVDGIARTTFDGDGDITQVDAVALNGNIPLVWRPGTGTYSLDSSCTGTMTLDNQGQAPRHLAILVSQSGNIIHAVVTDQGFAISAQADRLSVPRKED